MDTIINFDKANGLLQDHLTGSALAWTKYLEELEASVGKSEDAAKQLIISELKHCTFANMMEIGWKLIIYSTGVPGFKFGEEDSMFKNPHVAPILPPFVVGPRGVVTAATFWPTLVGASSYRGGSKKDKRDPSSPPPAKKDQKRK